MRILIQRCSEAQVTLPDGCSPAIPRGLVVLLGIESRDQPSDADWLTAKLLNLRIFEDEEGRMHHSVQDISGSVLLVSQFTLHAKTKKGNRPSFTRAASPEQAQPLYDYFAERLRATLGERLKTGYFGAYMKISLINDGPVTLLIDSQNRE